MFDDVRIEDARGKRNGHRTLQELLPEHRPQGGRPRTRSAAFSAIMMTRRVDVAADHVGHHEASTTRSPRRPALSTRDRPPQCRPSWRHAAGAERVMHGDAVARYRHRAPRRGLAIPAPPPRRRTAPGGLRGDSRASGLPSRACAGRLGCKEVLHDRRMSGRISGTQTDEAACSRGAGARGAPRTCPGKAAERREIRGRERRRREQDLRSGSGAPERDFRNATRPRHVRREAGAEEIGLRDGGAMRSAAHGAEERARLTTAGT